MKHCNVSPFELEQKSLLENWPCRSCCCPNFSTYTYRIARAEGFKTLQIRPPSTLNFMHLLLLGHGSSKNEITNGAFVSPNDFFHPLAIMWVVSIQAILAMNLRNSRAAAAVYLLTYCAKFLSSPDHRPDAVYRTTEKLIGALELQKRHDETILLVPHSVWKYPKIVSSKNVKFQYPEKYF